MIVDTKTLVIKVYSLKKGEFFHTLAQKGERLHNLGLLHVG